MAETQLTHKLRNPKSYNEWMDIWTSHVVKEEDENGQEIPNGNISYEIYPSSNWKIPITQLTPNTVEEQNGNQNIINNGQMPLPSGITVSVNQITDTNNIHNVTSPKSITPDALAKLDANGNLVSGPVLDPAGSSNKLLNEKGNWIDISGTAGIVVDGLTIKHSNTKITSGTAGTDSETFGYTTLEIPYITYDDYGHITAAGTHIHNLEGFLTSNGSETINGSRIIGDNSLNVSVINSTDLNSIIRAKLNTKESNGAVIAGGNNFSKTWLTDSTGNPSWGKITADHMATNLDLNNNLANDTISGEKIKDGTISGSKFDTKLFGTAICAEQPALNDNPSQSNEFNYWDYNHCGIWVEI